jgi:hypothetical protein
MAARGEAAVARGLLLVVLDGGARAGFCLVGFQPGRPAGATLAKQIPALVEGDLELGETLGRRIVEWRVSVLVAQLMFLVDEFVNAGENLLVVHRHM